MALGLLALVVFVGLSLFSYDPTDPPAPTVYPAAPHVNNLCGPLGAETAHGLLLAFGLAAWFALWTLLIADLRLFSRRQHGERYARMFGRVLTLVAVCVGLQMLFPMSGYGWWGPAIGPGGHVGAWGVAMLEQHVSLAGTMILMAAVFLSGIMLTDEARMLWLVFRMLIWLPLLPLRLIFGRRRPSKPDKSEAKRPRKRAVPDDDEESDEEDASDEDDDDEADVETDAEEAEIESDEGEVESPRRLPIKVNPPVTAASIRDEVLERLEAGSRETMDDDYEFPPLDLLELPEEFPYELLAEKAQKSAATLEKTFKEFGLNVRVVEVDTGPVITQFELELEAGLRLSKVTALADDLAIALRVPAVRVVAPIPGKNTVGVEVPNEKQVMVRLRELIEARPDEVENRRLPIFLGKDVSGRPLTVDLAQMPHLLIAGRTGTGKSVCLNALILSLLMTRTPEEVKMLMIDPKMVELSPYKRIPHLMHPVITDMKKAEAVLAWAVDKMEERYDLFARVGVRHLDQFNKLGRAKVLKRLALDADSEEAERIPRHMPYIVIIADEMADLMMTSSKDVEGYIIRLAQKSRAVGIHLVLATQKPTVDVITGLIKSNLPARISFQVASRTDSRVVLDECGADRLLGNGDMLYLAPGTSNLTRAQGAYVSSEEIEEIIEFFSEIEPQYSSELAQITTASAAETDGIDAMRKRDELYEQAIEVVVREGRGSVSLLQRALGIGYGRGARLIDYMAEDGIVGEYNGSQAREVLYSPEQWEAVKLGKSPHALESSPA